MKVFEEIIQSVNGRFRSKIFGFPMFFLAGRSTQAPYCAWSGAWSFCPRRHRSVVGTFGKRARLQQFQMASLTDCCRKTISYVFDKNPFNENYNKWCFRDFFAREVRSVNKRCWKANALQWFVVRRTMQPSMHINILFCFILQQLHIIVYSYHMWICFDSSHTYLNIRCLWPYHPCNYIVYIVYIWLIFMIHDPCRYILVRRPPRPWSPKETVG